MLKDKTLTIFVVSVAIVFVAFVAAQPRRLTVVEASITDMQRALQQHRVTSRELVQQSLTRIALYEDRLNAIVYVNPRALEEADQRDQERSAGRLRGPLHGIPVALKDNIQTRDMPTTGGALAFAGVLPPYDATVAKNLRDAGAIIIAKTQLTELANWVTVGMPANYNSLNGYGMNPYDPLVTLVAIVALASSALVASLIPAFRASSISPLQALRIEGI